MNKELTEARIREIVRTEIKLVFEDRARKRMKMVAGIAKEQKIIKEKGQDNRGS